MHRLFLDANVLFSAAYNRAGRVGQLWQLRDVELLTTTYAIDEAYRNLEIDAQQQRLQSLLHSMIVVPPPRSRMPPGIDLPTKDQPIFLGAMDARATHLITGDARHFGKYFGRQISGIITLRPNDYLIAR